MKKQFLSTTVQLIAVILLLLVAPAIRAQSVAITVAYLTSAGGNEPLESNDGSVRSAEVHYVSNQGADGLFNVVYANSSGARFSVKVLDNEGHQLFQGVYTDKKFDRKFKIADVRNYDRLTFIIRNFQDNSVQRFEINASALAIANLPVK